MSDPKRYRLDPESYLAEHPQGDFIDYQDYARLKAEVERLTKAGDEVIREWSSGDETAAQNFLKALVIWNAAKEGKGQP